jgi:outer membrane protein OmpA-like peptidoglycan-associated protein
MFQKSGISLITFLILLLARVVSQNADCDQMLILKDTIYHTKAIVGFGAKEEFSGSAIEDAKTFEKEVNSIWYFITAEKDAVLTFDIIAESKSDDWDFVLYAYSKGFCKKVANNKLVALRSNLSRSPITGLSRKGKKSFVGAGVNANYSRPIRITKGARYVLVVNNPKRAGGKHTLVLHYESKQKIKKPIPQVVIKPKVVREVETPLGLITKFKLELKDAITKEPVVAFATISGFEDGVIEVSRKSTYEKELIKKNHKIIIDASAKGYMLKSQTVNISKNKSTFLVELLLEKIELGRKVNLKNIQFYGNEAVFLPKATSSLKVLLFFMKQNPNVTIEVEGHVNGPGQKNSKDYQQLSYSRAYAVKSYLIENGIMKDRIDFKGYGNSQMLYPSPKSAHQESSNRRVEIKILSNEYHSGN